MSTKYKFRDQDQLYFISFSVVYWIDLFIRNEYKQIMLDSWKHCQVNKGLEIYGWCIMTSHIHMIIGSHGDKLEEIMRDMKRHTSIALKQAIQQHQSGASIPTWREYAALIIALATRDFLCLNYRHLHSHCLKCISHDLARVCSVDKSVGVLVTFYFRTR